jgi:hypothetical protein
VKRLLALIGGRQPSLLSNMVVSDMVSVTGLCCHARSAARQCARTTSSRSTAKAMRPAGRLADHIIPHQKKRLTAPESRAKAGRQHYRSASAANQCSQHSQRVLRGLSRTRHPGRRRCPGTAPLAGLNGAGVVKDRVKMRRRTIEGKSAARSARPRVPT